MATITVCDECGEEIERVKITVTDNHTGDTEEVCSTKCMKLAVDRQERHAREADVV
jgi:hypothetical protein